MSQWLPVAPHLTSMITDFFVHDQIRSKVSLRLNQIFRSKSASMSSMTTTTTMQYISIHALYNISKFYSDRGDKSLPFDWSFVFTMIGSDDGGGTTTTSDEAGVDSMDVDVDMNNEHRFHNSKSSSSSPISMSGPEMLQVAIRWFSARIIGYIMDWRPLLVTKFLKRLKLESEQVPWMNHPWEIDREESTIQNLRFRGLGKLPPWGGNSSKFSSSGDNDIGDDDESILFHVPTSEDVRRVLPLHPWLADVGLGLIVYKIDDITSSTTQIANNENNANKTDDIDNSCDDGNEDNYSCDIQSQRRQLIQQRLIATPTTCRNLSLLGTAMSQEPYPPPILICGPHGSGKSSILRELVRLCNPNGTLLEVHVDEETDSKTLIGSYTATDIPGEFAWRPGALTRATRDGQWVLLEDVDGVPIEIQASLVKLLKDRLVPLGNGKYEKCHPKFRLFGTCTSSSSSLSPSSSQQSSQQEKRSSLRFGGHRAGGRQILNPSLWRKVHVHPLPYSELTDIADALYPNIPRSVSECALTLLRRLDRSGRAHTGCTSLNGNEGDETDAMESESMNDPSIQTRWVGGGGGGRQPSVRDFFKLLSRISNDICFEPNASYATESQRTLCLAESLDVFFGSCANQGLRQDFVSQVAAPIWGISRDLALRYVETRRPTTQIGESFIEVGRSKIEVVRRSEFARHPSETFAQTSYSLRIMESISVCIRENEPVLLVGETGCGE